MKKLITIIVFVLVACGKDDPAPPLVPENLYSTHITNFYTEASKRGWTLPTIKTVVRFNDTSYKCVGNSYGTSSSSKSGDTYYINIRKDFSNQKNDAAFYVPIFREMAHLLMNKSYSDQEFVNNGDGNGAVSNFMYPCATSQGYPNEPELALLFQK